ncbi:hypothetical protein CCR75_008110 [Bremia lactucae]|uniref:RRM domain-containing protein n=1 Tax=Bremia lactucae TaxID=4779 RepID=A0A976FLW5_BRELC|nr:hypothetical protein CCR75_008110 [Bremia lactucae]
MTFEVFNIEPGVNTSKAMTDLVTSPPMETVDVPPNHTLYLNNLNDKIKSDRMKATIYAMLSQHGKILEIVMGHSRRLRGQAWVTFDDVPCASNALRAINGSTLFEKPVAIQFAKEKADIITRREGTFVPREKRKREPKPVAPQQQSTKKKTNANESASAVGMAQMRAPAHNLPNKILFLEDLPESCNQDMLGVLFKQYQGFKVRSHINYYIFLMTRMLIARVTVQEVRMVPGKKGLAFVEFGDEAQAAIALQGLSGFKLTPADALKVSFAKK